uniref:AMP-binding protein n=1 Tax=Serratia quinivorans TaxID=137545 RepID=UPI0035C6CB46
MVLNLCPQIEGEEKMWRFIGIWMKNRWEWTATLLASMHYKITTVGFYDAMSSEQVDFILNQTEMTTVVVTPCRRSRPL